MNWVRMVLPAVVLIEQQGRHLPKAVLEALPTVGKTVDDEVAGDRRGGEVEIEFIVVR